MRRLTAALVVFLVMGCSTSRSSRHDYPAAWSAPVDPTGVVFVANGAGDSRSASENLRQVVAATRAPLQVETFDWSRGYRRYVTDQVDRDNHWARGRELASQVVAYRQQYPTRGIYLLGHSAGCAVVLIAAAQLPDNSIDRIVLLAPSVCTSYDLRPALRASRAGIDAFCSDKDRWVLGLGMRIVGTTEEGCRTAAGRVGFTPVIQAPTDAALYAKLRQHPWNPAVSWTGHDGGHFGNHEPAFLRAYVMPLLD
jgi:pimeloyl-ACP methyl ester carboxylesterase